ncbi:MAG: glycoside hydrolase family 88 protein [Bacteroidetes bacterium]|uniref:Glycoside hydrolase family 88 protein n=1 Tax=Candidatus Cryptobacteroides intestinavium TaxID=2840766 RepID=A0A9D9EUS9_9BACT|nr:glycoside hydrolase family 88 protein [Candidatus Cryptobacteroides intestinavium]
MNRIKNAGLVLLTAFLTGCSGEETMPELTKRVFDIAEKQYIMMDTRLKDDTMPRSMDSEGKFIDSNLRWWCSGFYPGSLWYIYEYTGNGQVRALAEKNTEKLDVLKIKGTDHDLGFQMNCSFGNAYRITGDERYAEPIRTSAEVLAGRFSPVTGVIKSWDFVNKGRDWKYPVIIDNMMNLEHLYNAGSLFGLDTLKTIALTHANTTMANHFRPDYTSWHLVDYDPETGAVRSKETVQGFSDSSAWARGQAWALYGYTMMFRMSGYDCYLSQAENIADMLLKRLPEDGIPYWDFDSDMIPDDYRDASAAAIMASAFIELSTLCNSPKKAAYLETAEKQLRTLASDEYLAQPGENCNFILRHSVGSLPGNSEVDVPLTYADYYFLEALLRYSRLSE